MDSPPNDFDETRLWSEFSPEAWENSINSDDSFFHSLYDDTIWYVRRLLEDYELDASIEVGCGTGQIIETVAQKTMDKPYRFYGIDINESFIQHCNDVGKANVSYTVGDATQLNDWKNKTAPELNDMKTLVTCVNNTLSIMPPEIRPAVVYQMRKLAGKKGIIFLTYWNGMKFREGLVQFYKKNPDLCGHFDIAVQDFQRRKLHTETGYSSHWPLENEVELMVISYGVSPRDIIDIKVVGKGIFVIVSGLEDNNAQS